MFREAANISPKSRDLLQHWNWFPEPCTRQQFPILRFFQRNIVDTLLPCLQIILSFVHFSALTSLPGKRVSPIIKASYSGTISFQFFLIEILSHQCPISKARASFNMRTGFPSLIWPQDLDVINTFLLISFPFLNL